MPTKIQSGVELISTYGLMVLIVVIVAAVIVVSFSHSSALIPASCSSYGSVQCKDLVYGNVSTSNSALILLASMPTTGAVNVSSFTATVGGVTGTGYCTNTGASSGRTSASAGNDLYCVANFPTKPNVGSVYHGTYEIEANYCSTASGSASCPSGSSYTFSGSFSTAATSNPSVSSVNQAAGLFSGTQNTIAANFALFGNATAVIPITLTNAQASATPANFQQMITFNPSSYSSQEASNLGNVRFYQGTSELYSWCESGCNSSSGDAIFWALIPGGMAASSNTTINMTFQPASANYDGAYAGEAPQLSPSYAEYDNGGNVFSFYQNFNGTSCPSGWSCKGAYQVNGGLRLGGTASASLNPIWFSAAATGYSATAPAILEFYGAIAATTGGSFLGVQARNPCTSLLCPFVPETQTPAVGYGVIGSSSNLGEGIADVGDYGGPNDHAPFSALPSSGNHVFSLLINSSGYGHGTTVAQYDYQAAAEAVLPTAEGGSLGNLELATTATGSSLNSYWVRARAYPPDGVMPAAAFKGIETVSTGQTTTTIPPTTTVPQLGAIGAPAFSASYIDLGQNVLISDYAVNGTAPPYAYNFIVKNGAGGAIAWSSGPLQSNKTGYTPTATGSFFANVIVTDSYNPAITRNSTGSATLGVSPDPTVSKLAAKSNSITYGSTDTFNAVISGGVGPYAAYLMASNGTVVASNTVNSYSSGTATFNAIPDAGAVAYYVSAVDLGASPNFQFSNSTTVSVTASRTPLVRVPAPSISGNVLDSGQQLSISLTLYNGIPPYTYNFIVSNSVSKAVVWSSGPQGSNVISYNTPNRGNFFANVVVTDSSNVPVTKNSTRSAKFNVSSAPTLGLYASAPINNVATAGQWMILAATPNGGTGVYALNLIAASNGTVVGGATGSSGGTSDFFLYAPLKAGVYQYYASGTDTGTSAPYGFNDPTPLTLTVTPITNFVESGLPSGASFNAIYDGISSGGTGNSLSFSTATSGNYSYSISASVYGGTTYLPVPQSGNLIAGSTLNVQFLSQGSVGFPVLGGGTALDVGQPETISAYIANGVPPYTYNFIVSNSVSKAVVWSSGPQQSNTTTYSTPLAGKFAANVVVTKSSNTPITMNSVYSAAFTVAPAASLSALRAGNNPAQSGTADLFIVMLSGGTGPFTLNLIASNGTVVSTAAPSADGNINFFYVTIPPLPGPHQYYVTGVDDGSSVPLAFANTTLYTVNTYTVTTFTESGLPSGATFNVVYDGTSQSQLISASGTKSLQFLTYYPGSYPYSLSSSEYNGLAYGTSVPQSGILSAGSTQAIPYLSSTGFVVFGENGVVATVTYNGISANVLINSNNFFGIDIEALPGLWYGPSAGMVSFLTPSGSYPYNIVAGGVLWWQGVVQAGSSPAGYFLPMSLYSTSTTTSTSTSTSSTSTSTSSTSSSTTSTTVPSNQAPFTETGLPSGATFNVLYNGLYNSILVGSSPSNSLLFQMTTGNYPFNVTKVPYGPLVYIPYPANGSVSVGTGTNVYFFANQITTLPGCGGTTCAGVPTAQIISQLNAFILPNVTAGTPLGLDLPMYNITGSGSYGGPSIVMNCNPDLTGTEGAICLIEFDFNSAGDLVNVDST